MLTNLNNSPKRNNFHFFSQIFRNLLHAQNRIFWNDRKQFSKHSQTWDNKLRPKSRFCTPFALVFGCCQCDQIGVFRLYVEDWSSELHNSGISQFLLSFYAQKFRISEVAELRNQELQSLDSKGRCIKTSPLSLLRISGVLEFVSELVSWGVTEFRPSHTGGTPIWSHWLLAFKNRKVSLSSNSQKGNFLYKKSLSFFTCTVNKI